METRIGALVFACPKTGDEVDSGIWTDSATLLSIRSLTVRVGCPVCKVPHEWPLGEGRLREIPLLPATLSTPANREKAHRKKAHQVRKRPAPPSTAGSRIPAVLASIGFIPFPKGKAPTQVRRAAAYARSLDTDQGNGLKAGAFFQSTADFPWAGVMFKAQECAFGEDFTRERLRSAIARRRENASHQWLAAKDQRLTSAREQLASARRRVAEGKQRISRQLVVIAALERAGSNTAAAEALLESFIRAQATLEQYCQMIAREIEGGTR